MVGGISPRSLALSEDPKSSRGQRETHIKVVLSRPPNPQRGRNSEKSPPPTHPPGSHAKALVNLDRNDAQIAFGIAPAI